MVDHLLHISSGSASRPLDLELQQICKRRLCTLYFVCIDQLRFDERGLIVPVRITREGVERDALSAP